MNFEQIQGDYNIFIKKSTNGKVTILIVYFDDIIVTRVDLEEIELLKTHLAK